MAGRRFPLGLALIAPVVIGMGVYAFTGQDELTPTATVGPTSTVSPASTETSTATEAPSDATATPSEWEQELDAAQTATAAASPTFPAPPSSPTSQPAVHGEFHAGAWVRVNAGEGDCLNARRQPSMTEPYATVTICLPHGHRGLITGSTQQADGHWWWYLAGAGFVAEDYLVYDGPADLRSANAPHLASEPGMIAFVRDGSIWVMRPDGSEQRELVPAVTYEGFTYDPTNLTWSPDGRLLSFTRYRPRETASFDLHIVDLAGVERVAEGVSGSSWSPDSSTLAVLASSQGDGMSGYTGAPAILDVATMAVRVLPISAPWAGATYSQDPQYNYDGSLVVLPYSMPVSERVYENGIAGFGLDGSELVRLVRGEDEWNSGVSLSPAANTFAALASRRDGDGYSSQYQIVDLFTRAVIAAMDLPPTDPNAGGGGCGGMDVLAWSRDGSRMFFEHTRGPAGTNGVWSLDAATGAASVVPAGSASRPSGGPGTLITFSAGNFIFAGDTAGGFPTLITDGRSPVWSSGQ